MPDDSKSRRCVALPERFFCDGPYYVITSASLGGGRLTPKELADILGQGDESDIEDLLKRGVCLLIFFPGDCALDRAIIVIGDLSEQEEAEWLGRISSKLSIPCGKLLIFCGGGDEGDIEGAISGEGLDGYDEYFASVSVPPREYLVEIYAYVSSMNVDFYFEDDEPLEEWFHRTRPGLEMPLWLKYFNQGRAIGELGDELVSYIIRLAPLVTEPPVPRLVEEIGWCGEFEFRRPELCPLGIPRSTTLNQ
ncbi:MAG: hypothetical protein L0229_30135 [Blastocatellia bacterium]|nr:hypothetical protein [Blastocatellia bacterium]